MYFKFQTCVLSILSFRTNKICFNYSMVIIDIDVIFITPSHWWYHFVNGHVTLVLSYSHRCFFVCFFLLSFSHWCLHFITFTLMFAFCHRHTQYPLDLDTPISSTNRNDQQDINEILLKVALRTFVNVNNFLNGLFRFDHIDPVVLSVLTSGMVDHRIKL